MSNAHLVYPAHDIRTEGLAFDRSLSHEWLTGALEGVDATPASDLPGVRVRGRLSRSRGRDIVVRGRVDTTLVLPCARCLSPVEATVVGELSLLLRPQARGVARPRAAPASSSSAAAAAGRSAEEYEFEADEAEFDVYDGEAVELDGFVREAILLEVPNFPLCRDDCPGLSALTSDHAEVARFDPRLAPLSAFRKREGPASIDDLLEAAAQRGLAMGRKPVLRAHQGGKGRGKKRKK